MKNIKNKQLNWALSSERDLFTKLINDNKIILGPSDTVLGLYGAITQEAFLKLNTLKNRCEKPYLLLVKNKEQALSFIDLENIRPYLDLLDMYWPGPLTIIAQARKDLPEWINSYKKTVAIRVPRHETLLTILNTLPALFSTSANLAGQPVPVSLHDVELSIVNNVDAIVIDESDQIVKEPSTIIDISSGKIVVVRQGALKVSLE